ncbi:MAG TPA: MATE family efflux transporter [Sedimentisphaerales bacterium]|nr:MATE family efflux transporter [Sedimentisphaerales bacterium]
MSYDPALPSEEDTNSIRAPENQLMDALSDETSLGHMLKLAGPMVVVHISFTIMQFVDMRMVAALGTNELAAILPAGLLSFIPGSFGLGVIRIVNTFVSQSLGRADKPACSNYCWQVIFMGFVYSVVCLGILWPTAPWIFRVIGQPVEIIGLEITYLRIMLYTQFLLVLSWSSSQFFMGIQRPIISMYAMVTGQVVNVAANYVLIFGRLGFPAMGIAGAGWGTFMGVGVSVLISMFMFLTGDINRTFKSRRSLRIDLRKMIDIVRVGFPAGFGLMINISFWSLILFGLVGRFGKESLAATGAVWSCIRVSFMPIIGIGTALTAVVGKSIGRDRKEAAIKQTALCLKVALVYMGFIGLCCFVFRRPIMRFWAPYDEEVVRIGMGLLMCGAVFQIFDAVLIIYGDALRGAGDTVWIALVEMVGASLFLGVGGYLMVKLFPELGAMGPWMAGTAKIAFGAAANRWRFRSRRWMRIDLFERRAETVPVEVAAPVE